MKPSHFIKRIRESWDGAEHVYLYGSCVQFFLIVKTVYPEAIPFWSDTERHLIFKIGRSYYDIRGLLEGKPDSYRLVKHATKISWCKLVSVKIVESVLKNPLILHK